MRNTVVMNLSYSYLSLQLGRELLRIKLKIYVTIRNNRTEFPTVFTFTKGEKLFCNIYGFQKDVKIVSHCPKKNETVKLLGAMRNEESILSSGENNSEIIQYYISTNGVVDTMIQMFRYYRTKRLTRRWPIVVFFQHDSYTRNEIHNYICICNFKLLNKIKEESDVLCLYISKFS